MAYFNQDFLDFFFELEKNNNREWFQDNKKRYEKSVKEPFENFVADLIGRLGKFHPDIAITPKEAIFRINRDIRFSKDKSPYKTHMSALVSSGGKKDKTRPGAYVQFNHQDLRLYSGAHLLEKDQLHKVRNHIAHNLDLFAKLLNDKDFKLVFGEVLGEKNKRLPPEFAPLEPKQPLIANKSFYYFTKMSPKTALRTDLLDELVSRYKAGLKMGNFFTEALES